MEPRFHTMDEKVGGYYRVPASSATLDLPLARSTCDKADSRRGRSIRMAAHRLEQRRTEHDSLHQAPTT